MRETKCYIVIGMVEDHVEYAPSFKRFRDALAYGEEMAGICELKLVDVGEEMRSWYNGDTKQHILLSQSWYNS